MPESVRVDGQLVKLEWNFDESEQQRVIGAQSQFSMMFPKYREKYLRDIMEDIVSYLKSRTVDCEINFLKGDITAKTLPNCFDPTQYFISRDFLRLICRGCDFENAKLVFEDGNISTIINLNIFSGTKKLLVNRRNRLFGPDGVTLKAIELITKTKCIIQGRTMVIIGKPKGVERARKVVEDAMKNIHPILNIKRLMVLKELENNPEMQGKDWSIHLPPLKIKQPEDKSNRNRQKKHKKIVKKSKDSIKDDDGFVIDLPKSKIDLQIESGEYFMKKEIEKANKANKYSGKYK